MSEDPGALAPELCLLGGAVVGLLVGLFLPRRRQWLVAVVGAVALLAGLAATAVAATQPGRMVFGESYAVDAGLNAARIIVLAATLLVVCLSVETVRGNARETEFYVLALLAALGAVMLAGASDLLALVAAYLLASVPGYALAGFVKDAAGTEAALKYYLMGALLGIAMLAGVTILLGVSGGTTYRTLHGAIGQAPHGAVAVGVVVLLAGLAFKVGAVPAHFWVPDVTEGASAPAAAFLTTVPKVGAVVATYRLFDQALPHASVRWPLLVALLAAVSMTLGNLAAFYQTSPRRLLAYSTISQAGYVLMAVAAAGRSELATRTLLFYLAGYAVTNLGAFAVVTELPAARRLDDYGGLFRRQPWLALTLVVCLLGLVGTPPTAVFVGKLGVFTAAAGAGLAWLMVVAAINTVASVFYYLRWIVPMFARTLPARAEAQEQAGAWSRGCAYAAAVATILLGLASGPVLAQLTHPLLGG
ncbi:MAG TPA: NADH-quinone oxidoreductase subunit N [Actinomycetota bacterium]|nr:NADH-quinone oxidoreductase subunit N [Actinomycetota bacterium]